jgi:hypothetical protein
VQKTYVRFDVSLVANIQIAISWCQRLIVSFAVCRVRMWQSYTGRMKHSEGKATRIVEPENERLAVVRGR